MTIVEKIDFLIECLDITEKTFSKKYRIRKNVISKWRKNEAEPKKENVEFLCEKFGFEVNDFLDDSSSLDAKNLKVNEHFISSKKGDVTSEINEDFPPENNARYEEKD